MSLLSWERGLKLQYPECSLQPQPSLLSWERGLKFSNDGSAFVGEIIVAPLVGAWIEITQNTAERWNQSVAPLVGAWIEIDLKSLRAMWRLVAPLVGAWIEILSTSPAAHCSTSLLSWERGLKSAQRGRRGRHQGRSSRGSVD